MFFRSLTSLLPATTEVVTEMSAILPDRADGRRGELDFYINSGYHYGIELMRDGGNFAEHQKRFEEPQPGDRNRGKYFTPLIKEYLIVDFRNAGFKSKQPDIFGLIVSFNEDFNFM